LPAGSQYDDYVVLQPEGAGEIGLEGATQAIEAEIVGLRDKEEPGKYAHIWGTLFCDVPDYGGCQLVVTQVRYGPTLTEPEPVEAWEGAAGPGVGEWIELRFPGTLEAHSMGVDVGLDRDADIFYANNRIKRATFFFSNGEKVTLDFSDTRGLQVVPLVRAPGPNIETTSVRMVIDEVYPGSRYDDTCLAEIEVWGRAQ